VGGQSGRAVPQRGRDGKRWGWPHCGGRKDPPVRHHGSRHIPLSVRPVFGIDVRDMQASEKSGPGCGFSSPLFRRAAEYVAIAAVTGNSSECNL